MTSNEARRIGQLNDGLVIAMEALDRIALGIDLEGMRLDAETALKRIRSSEPKNWEHIYLLPVEEVEEVDLTK